jgi:hypothetical protein
MKKFEYKLLTISAAHLSNDKFQAELDDKFRTWGNQGWELIKMEPINSTGWFSYGSSTDKFIVVFKREKQQKVTSGPGERNFE